MLSIGVSKPSLHFQMDAMKSHRTAASLCPSPWTGGKPAARATWEEGYPGCSPVTLALSGRTCHACLGCSLWPADCLCYPTTMLPCKRKGCRLPRAKAREMRNKGSFWNHSVWRFGKHQVKELRYSWTNLSSHSHFKLSTASVPMRILSQCLNIPICFDRNRMTQL